MATSRAAAVLAILCSITGSAEGDTWSRSVSLAGTSSVFATETRRDGSALIGIHATGGPCVVTVPPDGVLGPPTCLGIDRGSGIVPAADGGYFSFDTGFEEIAGRTERIASIVRMSSTSAVVWSTRLRSGEGVSINGGAVTPDGGILLVGAAGAFDRNPYSAAAALAVKMSRTGAIEWQQLFDVTGYESFTFVSTVRDGYVVAGRGHYGARVARLDSRGRMRWQYWFRRASNIADIVQLPGGDFVAVGDANYWMARVSGDGKPVWERQSANEGGALHRVLVQRDASLLAVGEGSRSGRSTLQMLAVDERGSALWQRSILFGSGYRFAGWTTMKDGSLLVVSKHGEPVQLHKLDNDGRGSSCLNYTAGTVALDAVQSVAVSAPLETPAGNIGVTPLALTPVSGALLPAAACTPAEPLQVAVEPVVTAVDAPIRTINEEKAHFDKRVAALLSARDFDALNTLGAEVRGQEFDDGSSMSERFYRVMASSAPAFGTEEEHLARMEMWLSAHPRSPSAAIGAAATYHRYAFQARGGGYSSTVTASAQAKFTKLMNRALDILKQSASFATVDPAYYALRVRVTGPLDCSAAKRLAYDEAAARAAYTPFFYEAAFYFFERWCGTLEESGRFAAYAADATRAKYGDGMYAVLVSDLVLGDDGGADVMRKMQVDWPRLRRGFFDLMQRYPKTPVYAHQLANVAWIADDRATAREMFNRPQLAWGQSAVETWKSKSDYDQARAWAMTEPPAPAQRPASVATQTPPALPAKPTPASELRRPEVTPTSWIAKAAADWPALFMRNEIKLRDGRSITDANSFLVRTVSGVVAVSALTTLGKRTVMALPPNSPVPATVLYEPIASDVFRSQLLTWTMAPPAKSGQSLAVAVVEQLSGSSSHEVVLTLKAAKGSLPVHVLDLRPVPEALPARVYVVGCSAPGPKCTQSAYAGKVFSYDKSPEGSFRVLTIAFDDPISWEQFIGSPVIDDQGFVVGVVRGPGSSSGPKGQQPNEMDVAAIEELLRRARLSGRS